MNRFKVKNVFCKNTLLLLSVILFVSVLLPGSAIAAEPPIINGKTKMSPGAQQVLSIMNYQTGNTYTWSKLSGGGSLNANSGHKVIYTAPTSNPNCAGNPTIQVVDSDGNIGSIQIAINVYTASDTAFTVLESTYRLPKAVSVGSWPNCPESACGTGRGAAVSIERRFLKYSCNGNNIGSQICWNMSGGCCGYCPTCLEVSAMYISSFHSDSEAICTRNNGPFGDKRTAAQKAAGCCPEALLPDYEPKKPAPSNVDFGIDTGEICPVRKTSKVGNPISIYTGNNFEAQTDLTFPSPGGYPFEFKRYYNSRSGTNANIGYGWIHNLRADLTPAYEYNGEIYLMLLDETGRSVYFTNQGGGLYSGAFKERSHVRVESGHYVWYRLDGRRFVFNSAKNLIRMEEPSGQYRMLAYNTSNRLESVTDGTSTRTLTFNYNAGGRVEFISGPVTAAVPDGIWVRYGYDASGNLTSATYADGSGFNYEYSNPANHNLNAKRDKQGHLLSSWTYDSQDRSVSNFTRDGKGVNINYVSDNEVRVTDAYGITRTYAIWEIDGRKKVTNISSPSGCAACSDDIKRVSYDSHGRIIEIEYANGLINQYDDFDSRGNARIFRQAVLTPDEKTVTYTFHPEIGAKLSQSDPSLLGTGNKVTIWDYDDDGNDTPNENPTRRVYRLIERGFTRDAAGYVIPYESITAYTYNSKGQVLTIDGPAPGSEDTTTFTYDDSSAAGNLLTVNRPLAGTVAYSNYDGAGRAGRIVDENGSATVFTYDAPGRVRTVTSESDASVTTYNYNIAGVPDRVIAANGVAADFEYDAAYGRLVRMLDPLGNYMSYDYDAQGNRIEESIYNPTAERVFWKRFDYQSPQHPGKLWKEINPDESYTEYSYLAGGNVASVKDPADKVVSYDYDILNRIVSVTQPGSVVTVYDYDRQDNLTSVTDAEGQRTTYEYDDLGRLLNSDSPDTGVTAYAYDIAGNLISKTDANGITITYSYDTLNRLTAILYPDSAQNVYISYDQAQNGMGRLSGIQDPSGTLSYGYDFAGRLIRATWTINGLKFSTLYAYNPAGQIREMTYPNGRMVRYDYDAAGRIARVVSRFEGVETVLADEIIHLPFGPISSMRYGNGLVLSSGFDRLYRPETAQAGAVYSRSISYDPSGNISAINNLLDPYRNQSFNYDELNRLTEAEGIYGAIGYTYDQVGNRLSKNHGGVLDIYRYIPGTNKLSEAGGMSYRYDANGNPANVGTRSLFYNQNNRLIRAAQNGSVLGEYSYNALGQRVVKRKETQTTLFIYDQQGNLMAEADGKGSITQEYIQLEGCLLAGLKSGKQVIEAVLDMDPDTLNLDSRGNWITAYIELPQGFDAAEIDPATITLNQVVYADRVEIGDYNGNGIPDLMVKFDRTQVSGMLPLGDAIEIAVEGEADAFSISGTDTIRVIGKGNKKGQGTAARAISALSTASKSIRLVFYHLDHLGTPQVITNENGEIVWSADYLPFGEVSVTTNAVGNEFRFPGQYYDAETELHYNYHRYYDPKTGRYLTPDPIGLAGDINLYYYANANPIYYFDYDGCLVGTLIGIGSGAFGGFISGLQSGKGYSAAIIGGVTGAMVGGLIGSVNPFAAYKGGSIAGGLAAGMIGGFGGGATSGLINWLKDDACALEILDSANEGALSSAITGTAAIPVIYFATIGVAGAGGSAWIAEGAIAGASQSIKFPVGLLSSSIIPKGGNFFR